jgi:hypothetical protein
MKKRWVLGGAALALGALSTVGAWPAAADAPTVTFSTPSEGQSVTEQVVVHGDGHMPDNGDTVTGFTVRLDSGAGHDVGPVAFTGSAFHWTPDVPWNGVYTAVARATGTDGPFDFNGPETGPPASVTFKVERLPVAPSGVSTSVDEQKRVVTISWNANPEPDILGYLVFRGGKGIAYVPETTKYQDALKDLPAGEYEYQVYAVREDANPDDKQTLTSAPTRTTANVKSAPTVALSGSSTATTTPRSTSGSSGSSGSGNRPPSSGGRVNLSGYSNLLPDRSELPLAPSSRTTEADDGFSEDLPFAAGSPRTSIVSGEAAAEQLNGDPVSASGDSRPESLLFLAAGLLVTVILMHVLWIKSEVDRVPLEPLAPEVAVKP